jgi:hypothetical protein
MAVQPGATVDAQPEGALRTWDAECCGDEQEGEEKCPAFVHSMPYRMSFSSTVFREKGKIPAIPFLKPKIAGIEHLPGASFPYRDHECASDKIQGLRGTSAAIVLAWRIGLTFPITLLLQVLDEAPC